MKDLIRLTLFAVASLLSIPTAEANQIQMPKVMAESLQPCYDLPGTKLTCGSYCWPFCGSQSSSSYDFNHYMVIPEERSCYLGNIDYGRFNVYKPYNTYLAVTYDAYTIQDGVCTLNVTDATLGSGAFDGSQYCQLYMKVAMGDCNGCADKHRRIELYSDKDIGCGNEFYSGPPLPESCWSCPNSCVNGQCASGTQAAVADSASFLKTGSVLSMIGVMVALLQ